MIRKYINIHIECTSQATIKAKKVAKTIWLNSEIKFLFYKKHVIVEENGNLESIISQNLNHTHISSFKKNIFNKNYN